MFIMHFANLLASCINDDDWLCFQFYQCRATKSLNIVFVRLIFWISPSQIRPLQKFDEIHPANRLQAATVAALGGNGRQEAVTASN
jgi:hypothetical protein